jgi:hypothetical protein
MEKRMLAGTGMEISVVGFGADQVDGILPAAAELELGAEEIAFAEGDRV